MVIGDEIETCEGLFKVVRKFWKSKGSKNQRLCDSEFAGRDPDRQFYLLESTDGRAIWAKELIRGDVEFEHNRLRLCQGVSVELNGISVCPARLVDRKDRLILTDYYGEHTTLIAVPAKKLRGLIIHAVKEWIWAAPVLKNNFDFSMYNILVKQDDRINVVLVDFATGVQVTDKTRIKPR